MSQPRIVAWRSSSELLQLKSDFFPSSDSADTRPAAISKVTTWQTRVRIPHSIESTSQITSAVLLDHPHSHPLTVRLAYSTAIIRFVNGLLDPAQQSQFALPMHLLARNLNLPASFVELRHAATHESLPSLAVLRAMAHRALDWLWNDYWAALGTEEEVEEEPAMVERARTAVKTWRRLRREAPMAVVKADHEVVKVVKECVDISRADAEALVAALLEEKVLIPAGKKKAAKMKGARMLWMPLLLEIEAAVPGFIAGLVGAMEEVLKGGEELAAALLRETRGGELEGDEDYLAAVYAWMEFLTAKQQTVSGRIGVGINVEELAKQALITPNEWNIQLLKHILVEYPALKPKYQALVDLAAMHVQTQGGKKGKKANDEKRSLEDIDAEIDAFEAQLDRIQQKRTKPTTTLLVKEDKKAQVAGKWRRWEGEWTPKPFGVL
ncbi:Las1-like-domain-containing protein [Pyronema domesticum]|uniref:Similar to Protein LAS1 acc. no. P36146 n=1 Tax=Pyronema omphalodes (strain CBS 100304) TaxID=1076935 RepID=U4LC98_PYROM|nr:Las1-like-domain-containing protein [Pyronema domesticum]CCX12043.1 Similar to Protein LAS1; acc. no. P36146 [Pyronema omphalodes CBS 100304]